MKVRSRDFEDGYDKAMSDAALSVQAMDMKLRDMERMFWSVVAASGGTVAVPRSVLQRFNEPQWEIREDVANHCVVYTVKV